MELESLRGEIERLQASKDWLLELIKRLQRTHALSGSGVPGAISRSEQHVAAAQAVVDYLRSTSCGDARCVCSAASSPKNSSTSGRPIRTSSDLWCCQQCGTLYRQEEPHCLKCDCEVVTKLRSL